MASTLDRAHKKLERDIVEAAMKRYAQIVRDYGDADSIIQYARREYSPAKARAMAKLTRACEALAKARK